MEFSIFLSLQRIHRPGEYGTSLYEEKRLETIAAEQLGYDMVWVPEHHLIHFIQGPSALLLAVHLGRDVSIPIGTMAVLLTTRHPLITAGELAMADQLLDGRLVIGVGRGAYEYEFQRFGMDFTEGRERFAEVMDILETIWASEGYSAKYDGKFFSFEEAAVWPRPVNRPVPESVWIAAMTQPTIAWAAGKGYNVSNWPFIRPMSDVEAVSQKFHDNAVNEGQKLTILRQTAVSHSEAELEKCIDEVLINHRINQSLHFYTQKSDESGYVHPEPLANEPSRQDCRENLLFGTPEEILAKVEEYDRLGVDELMLFFDFGPTHEEVMKQMELFATEVITPFKARQKSLT
jgi:alkanesulfonate monooxygenase SsuD/methylene tetrahydromethanopterin reductase-like flavin-dependent oxidoreductase (luciferase family)